MCGRRSQSGRTDRRTGHRRLDPAFWDTLDRRYVRHPSWRDGAIPGTRCGIERDISVTVRPVSDPPSMLDGAKVLAVADLATGRATGWIRFGRATEEFDELMARTLAGENVTEEMFANVLNETDDSIVYAAIARYEGHWEYYVFWCNEAWEVQYDDEPYASRAEAEESVLRGFEGLQFIDV
jgi:hypothetical protein